MAIAFDSALNTVTHGSPTSGFTDSFNNVAGTLLIVGIISRTTGDQITGCSYNGVAMTLVAKVNTNAASSWAYVFKLANPATGTNNISTTFSGSPADVRVTAASYSGASDVEASNTGTTASATSWTGSVTTITDNDWVGGFVMNDVTNNVATAPAVLRGVADDPNLLDLNSAQTPAGSKSIGGSIQGGASGNYGYIVFAMTPTAGGGGGTRQTLTMMGVGS
jgi:hypothetical protein